MSPFPSSPLAQEAVLAEPARMLGEVLGEDLAPAAVRPVYQPIVDLDGETAVGYEAVDARTGEDALTDSA